MIAVSDPRFRRGGANLLFGIFFVGKCMKMEKKKDGGGGEFASPLCPWNLVCHSNGENDDFIRALPNMRNEAGII